MEARETDKQERAVTPGELNAYLLVSIGMRKEPTRSHREILKPLPNVCGPTFYDVALTNGGYEARSHELAHDYFYNRFVSFGLARYDDWGNISLTDNGYLILEDIFEKHESGERVLEYLPEVMEKIRFDTADQA